jgi:hypothetical protein
VGGGSPRFGQNGANTSLERMRQDREPLFLRNSARAARGKSNSQTRAYLNTNGNLNAMRISLHTDFRKVLGQPTLPLEQAVGALLVLLILIPLLPAVEGRAQDSLSEYQVKAAYLVNFLKFVDWPEDAFGDPLAPIVIGVVGDDPFGVALPEVVVGKTVQGRDLVIRIYHTGEDLRGAHLLFISASERKRLPTILSALRGSSVLTVGDTEGFLESGGMIEFVPENNRVRFAINVEAANRAHLKMSSKLLSLAKVVKGNPKADGS